MTFPLLRWGLFLSVAVVALAVAYRLQQPLLLTDSNLDSTHNHDTDTEGHGDLTASAIHCYKQVKTLDPENPSAECFFVREGRFQQVMTLQQATALVTSQREEEHDDAEIEIHSHDAYAIPGLWDGHGHLLHYGQFLHSVDLFGAQSLDEVRNRIKAYLAEHPEAGTGDNWLRGIGWDQAAFGRMPTADDLSIDADLKPLYMMLERTDVHCSWVSQAVLDLLPASLPDIVPGGEIVRDPGMGVFCDNAVELITARLPPTTADQKATLVRSAMRELNKVGLVGMHDAGATPDTLQVYAQLADSEDWTMRVYSMLECHKRNTFCPQDAVKIMRNDSKLTVRGVKLFADGALGSWGSAMIDPYSDHPWTSGSLLINATDLTHVTQQWSSAGYQVNIHAIGDLANRNAIDAFESALRSQCPTPSSPAPSSSEPASLADCQSRHHRFRIEHAQIVHPDDQLRMHALGIIPSIQPTHATSDMAYAQDRLGPHRTSAEAYRMRTFLYPSYPSSSTPPQDANPIGENQNRRRPLILGSDFPVEPPNPFRGIYAAVTRKSPQTGWGNDPSSPETGWHTEEALTGDEALWGFTGGVAYGAFLEHEAGVIAKGFFADWVVLDDPLDVMHHDENDVGQDADGRKRPRHGIDVEDLRSLKVRETWVAGAKVHDAAEYQ